MAVVGQIEAFRDSMTSMTVGGAPGVHERLTEELIAHEL